MGTYQLSSVTDARLETGNYAMYVHASAGATAGQTGWTNLGAGMLKSFTYTAESFTSQSGNSIDPIQGIAKETATLDFDLIEYDGSSFAILSGGIITGSAAGMTLGGQTTVQGARSFKLVNNRTLVNGSTQTTTYVFVNTFMDGGFTMTPKSDNDTDPLNVYTFKMLCKQYATAQTICTKTVA